jgi:hypothetical protein
MYPSQYNEMYLTVSVKQGLPVLKDLPATHTIPENPIQVLEYKPQEI